MRLFSTKENIGFNAVIEGAFYEDWRDLNYQKTRIEIPRDTFILEDKLCKYFLYGVTDFEKIEKIKKKFGELTSNRNYLKICEKGEILSKKNRIQNNLDRLRTVYVKDGRIYVNKFMLSNKNYLEAISLIVEPLGEMFKNKDFSGTGKSLLKSYQ